MNTAEQEAARRAYLCDELIAAARAYYDRSDLITHDPESVSAANRLTQLLDTFSHDKPRSAA